MNPIVALNNSPYYYFNPLNQRSIGFTIPQTVRIAERLAKMINRVSNDMEGAFIPGIQLGAESDRALLSSSSSRDLRRVGEENEIKYIVHIPDQLVPGKYIKSGFKQRLLGFFQGFSGMNIEKFKMEMIKRIDATHEIGSRHMVMHLPNGQNEDIQEILRYFSSDISNRLEEHQISLALENCNHHDNSYFSEVENVRGLLDGLKGRYEFCFDYGHYIVGRKEIETDILRKHCRDAMVYHVHINDKTGDQHLFLGERPNGKAVSVLEDVEEIFIKNIAEGLDIKDKVFVLERNKPFNYAQLRNAVSILFDSFSL